MKNNKIKSKKKILITIDENIVKVMSSHSIKVSTLINNLLLNHLSLLSSPSSHSLDLAKITGSNPVRLIKKGSREEGLEIRDMISIYLSCKSNFIEWMNKYSPRYILSVSNRLDDLFKVMKDDSPKGILNTITNHKLEPQYTIKGFRCFLNYCEQEELLDDDILIQYRKKLKTKIKYNIDNKVPSKEDIIISLDKIRSSYRRDYLVLYQLLIESGIRWSEFKQLLLTYDKSKLECWDDKIVMYRNFYLRGTKSSFYCFFTKETFDKIDFKIINEQYLNSFHNKIMRDKSIISSKYLRKYNMQLMLENGITLETANYIQGRCSSNLGWEVYTNKKLIAVKEYHKIINIIN